MTNPNDPAFGKEGKHWFMTNEQWAKYHGLDKDLQSVAEIHQGLTKREEFAKAAMQGLSAVYQPFIVDKQGFAEECLARADALIAELNKEKQ